MEHIASPHPQEVMAWFGDIYTASFFAGIRIACMDQTKGLSNLETAVSISSWSSGHGVQLTQDKDQCCFTVQRYEEDHLGLILALNLNHLLWENLARETIAESIISACCWEQSFTRRAWIKNAPSHPILGCFSRSWKWLLTLVCLSTACFITLGNTG